MRSIRKRPSGTHQLEQQHQNPPATADEAERRWQRLKNKQGLLDMLLDEPEQYGLCAYCELPADEEGLGYHIEHVKPKNAYPQAAFDYTNLVASALAADDLAAFPADQVFAGHAKLRQYDPVRFISCLEPDCSRYFAYLSNGRVEPALGLDANDRARARYTIDDVLNLNSPYLVLLRRQWWDELDELLQAHLVDDASVEDLVCVDLLPAGRRLKRFFSLTRQFYADVAERVLHEQAPELA